MHSILQMPMHALMGKIRRIGLVKRFKNVKEEV